MTSLTTALDVSISGSTDTYDSYLVTDDTILKSLHRVNQLYTITLTQKVAITTYEEFRLDIVNAWIQMDSSKNNSLLCAKYIAYCVMMDIDNDA